MTVPPVFHLDDVTSSVIEDLRGASATYCSRYEYTSAFDNLILIPERAETIAGFLSGTTAASLLAERLGD